MEEVEEEIKEEIEQKEDEMLYVNEEIIINNEIAAGEEITIEHHNYDYSYEFPDNPYISEYEMKANQNFLDGL